MPKPLAIFDLDGTLRDTYDVIYPKAADVSIIDGIPERLAAVRKAGYCLVGATNQGGVSKGVISAAEVQKAIARTQKLLGEAALDVAFYCPHFEPNDNRYCDCKKPAPGLVLDALTALPGNTLDGSFVVGDSESSDGGLASSLAIPFLDVDKFMAVPPERLPSMLKSLVPASAAAKPNEDGIAGTLVGMAVGDALGAPLEFKPRSSVRRQHPGKLREMLASSTWAAGEYTDDTQMALLIADSLLARGELVPSDLAARFVAWARGAKDVGIQIGRVTSGPDFTKHPEKSAREDYAEHADSSAGNGGVMRCAPVALFHLGSLPMLIADSRRSARITHGDPKAHSSCVLVNVAIREAILNGTRDARKTALHLLPESERAPWERLMRIEKVPESGISSSGFTVSTVEAAFWSFLTTDSFEEAVVRAANLGDDADTVAAVTGALAGAYYGYAAIPARWKGKLKDEPHIREIALKLARHADDGSAGHSKRTAPKSRHKKA